MREFHPGSDRYILQEPFFCCDENIEQPISKVDSTFLNQWELAKSLSNSGGTSIPRSVASRAAYMLEDTILPVYFKQFNQALDQSHLTGTYNSAEYYLDQMLAIQPEHEITQQARATLVAEYINTAQSRINLYLQGKDFVAIQRIRSQFDENETSAGHSSVLLRGLQSAPRWSEIHGKEVHGLGAKGRHLQNERALFKESTQQRWCRQDKGK